MKILIIEDDQDIVSFLKKGLEENGYILDVSYDGESGEYLALVNNYDVIILDWMMPKKSGIDVLQSLRSKNISTPILMLSAKGETEDKIFGLKNGCDDYLSKPFSFDELEARLEALYRRGLSKSNTIINFQNIKIDLDKKTVLKDDNILNLSLKEYELLLFLIKYKNSFVSISKIEEGLYNNEQFLNSNVIQVTIYNLRKKLGKDIIQNSRGLGYKIEF